MEEPLILPFAHARHPREGGDPALARANRICSKQICSKAHRTPSQSRPAAHGWAAPVLAAMDGEARERDWLGVQCAVSPERWCWRGTPRCITRLQSDAVAQPSGREALRCGEGYQVRTARHGWRAAGILRLDARNMPGEDLIALIVAERPTVRSKCLASGSPPSRG